jgi:WD40 repeat protein
MNGSAAPPRYILSSSADATARLWSLDTMSNIVAYRGHQNPVWDVDWSPMGIYFATASRDRTARLWSTDRANSLRIYAGHLSDVDVSTANFKWAAALLTFVSVSGSTLILYIWRPALVTARLGYGMYRRAPQCAYLSDIKALSRRWRSAPMVNTSPVQVWLCRL